MSISIRKATTKDIDAIIDLAVEMVVFSVSPYREAPHGEIREFRRADLNVLKSFDKYPNMGIFVAEDENKSFIGHVIVVGGDIESSTGEKQGWIFDLSVSRDYWNMDVGKSLMRHAEKFIEDRGFKYLGMGVTSSNIRAVKFYESLGYGEERKRMIKKIG